MSLCKVAGAVIISLSILFLVHGEIFVEHRMLFVFQLYLMPSLDMTNWIVDGV